MPSKAPKHCKIQSRRDAPKMAILEAPCAQNAPGRSTMRPPETLLPRNPTWESPHFSGLTNIICVYMYTYIYLYIYICCEVINWSKSGVFKVINWAKSKLLTGPRSFSHYKNWGFQVICFAQLSLCASLFPIIWQFSKNSLFFQKRVQKLGFSVFCVLSLNFENYLFFGLLKHYKIGVSANFCVFVVEREEKGKKNDSWNFRIVFFFQKWPFRDAKLFSK